MNSGAEKPGANGPRTQFTASKRAIQRPWAELAVRWSTNSALGLITGAAGAGFLHDAGVGGNVANRGPPGRRRTSRNNLRFTDEPNGPPGKHIGIVRRVDHSTTTWSYVSLSLGNGLSIFPPGRTDGPDGGWWDVNGSIFDPLTDPLPSRLASPLNRRLGIWIPNGADHKARGFIGR